MTDRTEPRWRILAAALMAIALFAVAIDGLGVVLEPGGWARWALGVAAVTLGGSAAARALVPHWRIGACAVGLAAGAVATGAEAWSAGRLDDWLSDPALLIQGARVALYTGSAPVPVQGGLVELTVVACLALSWLSCLLIVGMDARLLGGVVPAALLVVGPAVTSHRTPGALMAAAGALLLALLWIGAPRRRGAWRGPVAIAVTIAMAAGLAAVLPTGRDRVWNTEANAVGPLAAGVPDVTIALSEDLRDAGTTPVFRYKNVPADQSARFTLAVLTGLEGATWRPEDRTDPSGAEVLNPRSPLVSSDPAAASWSSSTTAATRIPIDVEGLVSTWLPLPQGTQRAIPVNASDQHWQSADWQWVSDTQTARSTAAITQRGDGYVALSCPLVAAQLPNGCATLGDGSAWPIADTGSVSEMGEYLDLPDGVPASIADTAATVTANTANRASAAEALTQWFHGFAYDESAPYAPGADPSDPYQTMTAFLDQRRGYCVHFATTFAVMARSLGMPARVAVGYASRSGGPGWNTVTADDLHAWPEIYFEGVGWVAYEPTPGGAGARADAGAGAGSQQSGDDQSSAAGQTDPTPASGVRDPAEGRPDTGGGTQSGSAAAEPSDPSAAWGLLGGALALAAAALLIAPAWRRGSLRRRRRREIDGGDHPATAAWAEFVDAAVDLGILTVRAARPPEEARPRRSSSSLSARGHALPSHAPEAIAEALGAELPAEGAQAARLLADAVIAERFGDRTLDRTGRARLRQDLDRSVRGLRERTRNGSRVAARLRAALWPRSVTRALRPH